MKRLYRFLSLLGLLSLGLWHGLQAQTAGIVEKLKLETDSEVATAYTIIFDNSGSMKGQRIIQAKQAFQWWLGSVKAGNVWSVLRFADGGKGFVAVPFTPNGEQIAARAIQSFSPDQNTPITNTLRLAGVQIAARKIKKPYERHVLLLFTDGEENVDPAGNNAVARTIGDLRRQNIEVVSIGFAGAGDYLAQPSSRYFRADDETGLKTGLSQVEVEVDPMTPINVTDEELKQMANPPAERRVASPVPKTSVSTPAPAPAAPSAPLHPAKRRDDSVGHVVFLIVGLLVAFKLLKKFIKM